ncbi:ATP-binding protein [Streptomyces sp. NBC_01498]|uniref:ATP-binding protein n=1 Tax=Streptomyces sp. NBC_01498 TaxID=2975870 RepID=UPI002E7BF17A|nr:ATP-binding protein [Streptomyces sp. NBC_01498]WTL27885.1 ATP-binding protein [Streptomyces sp. NBC_01498]
MSDEPQSVILESPHRDTASARRAAAEFLTRHCPWVDLEAVLLVVSELVTNAVRHTSGWWRLHLTAGAGSLVVEIADSSPRLPEPRDPDFGGGGGFGWHMVQRLASRVEVRALPGGKRVRAIWDRPSRSKAAHAL